MVKKENLNQNNQPFCLNSSREIHDLRQRPTSLLNHRTSLMGVFSPGKYILACSIICQQVKSRDTRDVQTNLQHIIWKRSYSLIRNVWPVHMPLVLHFVCPFLRSFVSLKWYELNIIFSDIQDERQFFFLKTPYKNKHLENDLIDPLVCQ